MALIKDDLKKANRNLTEKYEETIENLKTITSKRNIWNGVIHNICEQRL